MLHDLSLLLRLGARHTRTFILRMFHILGADPMSDDGLGERAYQVYAAAIVAIWVVLMWAALLAGTETTFVALGASASIGVLSMALLVPVFLLAAAGFKALRTSPIKLSHPDIPFVAASPLGTGALVAVRAARSMVAGGVVAGLVGFVLGVGLNSGLGAFASPLTCAVVAALLVVAALGGSWAFGVARLVLKRRGRRGVVALLAVGLAAAVVCATLALGLAASSACLIPGGIKVVCACALALVCGEVLALGILAPRVDMTMVITENALFADLQQFGVFSPLDQTTIADYRRRRKLAERGPISRMPIAEGRGVLVAHAAVSLVRQYREVPSLLMQGMLVAPLGAIALFGGGEPVLLLFWLAALVLFPGGVRATTRVFRDDVRVRLVRDRLPFSTLELLTFDSLPAFVLVCAVSCVAVVLVLPAGMPVAMALVFAVLVNVAVILSCGLDAISLFRGGPKPFYEIGAIALALVAGLLSFAGSPLLVLAGIAAVCLVVALVVQGGIEHAW